MRISLASKRSCCGAVISSSLDKVVLIKSSGINEGGVKEGRLVWDRATAQAGNK